MACMKACGSHFRGWTTYPHQKRNRTQWASVFHSRHEGNFRSDFYIIPQRGKVLGKKCYSCLWNECERNRLIHALQLPNYLFFKPWNDQVNSRPTRACLWRRRPVGHSGNLSFCSPRRLWNVRTKHWEIDFMAKAKAKHLLSALSSTHWGM